MIYNVFVGSQVIVCNKLCTMYGVTAATTVGYV